MKLEEAIPSWVEPTLLFLNQSSILNSFLNKRV